MNSSIDPRVRMVQPDMSLGLFAIVQLPGETGEVRVRIRRRLRAGWLWRCDVHGSNANPVCAHVEATLKALGLMLAEVDDKGRP